MPRPDDNTEGNHRAAIATLEEARQRNKTRQEELRIQIGSLETTLGKCQTHLVELEAEAAALARGILALKGAQS